jgi:hypothetical protein
MVGFNNQGVSPSSSCADEIMPPYSDFNYSLTPGSAYAPSTYLQRTQGFGYTSNEGSSEQLPNGNVLVCLAIPGKILELDPSGTPIFTISTGAKSSQAHRYSSCYINNAAPAQPSVTTSGNNLISTTATTYQWYKNGNLIIGANSQTYSPSGNGIYVVRTTDINGCVYVYSKGVSFILGNKERISENISLSVFPNPGNGLFDLQLNGLRIEELEVSVFDQTGKQVYVARNRSRIDLSDYSPGVYVLKATINREHIVNQKIIISN